MEQNTGANLMRRRFLMGTAAVATATAIGLPFDAVNAATVLKTAAPDLDSYQPIFFNADEFKTICAMCDRLIPADDEGPGALETNVPVFLDLQLSGDYGDDWYLEGPFPKNPSPLFGYQLPYRPQEIYQRGLSLTETAARKAFNKSFSDLSDEQKDTFLTDLQKNKIDFQAMGEEYLSAAEFFHQVLGDVKNGYLADPMYGGNKGMAAWVMIGYPGARASFREWVTQHNVKYPLGPVSVKGQRA